MPKENATEKPKLTKAEKFVALGTKRMENAIKSIGLVGNLANKASYEFTPEQVAQIKTALDSAVEKVQERFDAALEGKSEDEASGFTFF